MDTYSPEDLAPVLKFAPSLRGLWFTGISFNLANDTNWWDSNEIVLTHFHMDSRSRLVFICVGLNDQRNSVDFDREIQKGHQTTFINTAACSNFQPAFIPSKRFNWWFFGLRLAITALLKINLRLCHWGRTVLPLAYSHWTRRLYLNNTGILSQ